MRRLVDLLRFIMAEFGSLVVFWLVFSGFGIKAAIAGTIGYVVLDALLRRWRHLAFTRIYLLSSGLAIVFGVVDLFATNPFMSKYEAVITNLATGAAFVGGARGAKPLLQEIAEKRQGEVFPARADVRRFFQLFTLAWASYFFVKAGVYLWIGAAFPLGRALALRSAIGGISLAAMTVLSITQGRRLFFLCRRLRLLPAETEHVT